MSEESTAGRENWWSKARRQKELDVFKENKINCGWVTGKEERGMK